MPQRADGRGIKINVGAFGSGYSSLSYRERHPLHELKIDQSFTQRIDRGDREEATVTTIIDLAHALDRMTVAEGVAMEAQKAFLVHRGCGLAKSHLLARWTPIDELCT